MHESERTPSRERGIPLENAFRGRRVFLTGHTGFKGSWMSMWLNRLGASVFGYALAPSGEPNVYTESGVQHDVANSYFGDIRDQAKLMSAVDAADPDVIFHLAAQPLVRESYRRPDATHAINYVGTLNLLEVVRTRMKPCAVVVITTDKCYENREQVWGYRECDPLGGHDPYAASKAAAELLVASYRNSFFPVDKTPKHRITLATARAGNVVGGGDWAVDRIVPDLVRALSAGEPIEIRSPLAVRPWQHVLEPLSGYLCLAAQMLGDTNGRFSEAWNFGPLPDGNRTVGILADAFIERWGGGNWHCPERDLGPHEAMSLRLSIDKSVSQLGWRPTWCFTETLNRTVDWYRSWVQGCNVRDVTFGDIAAYEAASDGMAAICCGQDRAIS